MLKENKREETTKNIEKMENLVEQVADGIWRIGVELPQNPLRELNSYLIKGKENERDLLIDTGFRREECRAQRPSARLCRPRRRLSKAFCGRNRTHIRHYSS